MARVPRRATAFGLALALLAVGPLVAVGEDLFWTTTNPDPNPIAWDEARLEPGTPAYRRFVQSNHQDEPRCTSYGSIRDGGSLSPPSECSQAIFTSPGGGGSPGDGGGSPTPSPGGAGGGGSPGGTTDGGEALGSPGGTDGGGTTDEDSAGGGTAGGTTPGPGAALTLVAFVVLAVIARREAR